jgi:hypothetical protein
MSAHDQLCRSPAIRQQDGSTISDRPRESRLTQAQGRRGFRICKAQSSIVSLPEGTDGRSIHSGLPTVLVIQMVAGPPGPAV